MKVKEIGSPENTTFKVFLKLTRARGIKKYEMALLAGPKQTSEVIRDFPDKCTGIIFSARHEPPAGPATHETPSYRLSPELFRQIDIFDTGHPVLLVRVEPFPLWDDGSCPSGCTLCVPFQDPANVGAAIRSAAAFGVSRIVVMKEAAHPFLPKALRVAGSAIFRVPVFEGPSLDRFRVSDKPVIALSQKGKDIGDYRFPPAFYLIPGLEGPGLPNHLKKATLLSIPMERHVESLNAALATGIALYLWQSERKLKTRQVL